jgi:hypothetical protein
MITHTHPTLPEFDNIRPETLVEANKSSLCTRMKLFHCWEGRTSLFACEMDFCH